MRDIIRIQMMGEFVIYINERQADHMVNKSRKGLALIEYLIVGSRAARFQSTAAFRVLGRRTRHQPGKRAQNVNQPRARDA